MFATVFHAFRSWPFIIAKLEASCFSNILFFFFNDTATTEIYTLSLHDALPISRKRQEDCRTWTPGCGPFPRSEEHTSELQSHSDLVCRLLLEKKKTDEYVAHFRSCRASKNNELHFLAERAP